VRPVGCLPTQKDRNVLKWCEAKVFKKTGGTELCLTAGCHVGGADQIDRLAKCDALGVRVKWEQGKEAYNDEAGHMKFLSGKDEKKGGGTSNTLDDLRYQKLVNLWGTFWVRKGCSLGLKKKVQNL